MFKIPSLVKGVILEVGQNWLTIADELSSNDVDILFESVPDWFELEQNLIFKGIFLNTSFTRFAASEYSINHPIFRPIPDQNLYRSQYYVLTT